MNTLLRKELYKVWKLLCSLCKLLCSLCKLLCSLCKLLYLEIVVYLESLEVKGFVSGQIVIGIMDVSWSIYDVCVDLYKMVYVLNYNGVYMLDYNGI